MARTAGPFPPPPRPAADPCDELATFFWAGEYQARCIGGKGHSGPHEDGITWSRDYEAFPASSEEAGR